MREKKKLIFFPHNSIERKHEFMLWNDVLKGELS